MLEADSAMDVTDKVGGVLRISPSGKSLLLALEDGTLQLRTFDGKAMSIGPHDTLRGGASCVTLELSGGYAVSSGLDGMVRGGSSRSWLPRAREGMFVPWAIRKSTNHRRFVSPVIPLSQSFLLYSKDFEAPAATPLPPPLPVRSPSFSLPYFHFSLCGTPL